MENFYQRTPTETLEYFHSDQTKGLSKQGAKEALDTYGENTIQQQESTSLGNCYGTI